MITQEELEKLQRLADEDGMEWGEAVERAIELFHVAHSISDEFEEMLSIELKKFCQ